MKKIAALALVAIFIFSLVPLAFAEEGSNDDTITRAELGEIKNIEDRREAMLKDDRREAMLKDERREANLKRVRIVRGEYRAKIEVLDSERLDKISRLSDERLQKIAELDKKQIERLAKLDIENLDRLAQLKRERLERISDLSQEKLERISQLEKDKLEKITDLDKTEIEKFSVLNRAMAKEFVNLDNEGLNARLRALEVVKVRRAEDLDRKRISEARLAQIRESVDKARDGLDKARAEMLSARESLKEAKEKGDEHRSFEHAKNYILRTSDALIRYLERIKANVQENPNIPKEREEVIVAKIDEQISEIAKIKADAEAATTKEQVIEAARKLHNIRKRLRYEIRLYAENIVLARVEGIINRGIVLEKRLDNVIAKAKEKGIEVNASAEISAFSDKIALAKDKQKQAEAKLSALLDLKAGNATNEQIRVASNEVDVLFKEARAAIKEAHEILKAIVKKIMEADPKAELSADAEVEVAEEK